MKGNFLDEIKSNYIVVPYKALDKIYKVLIPLNDHLMKGFTNEEFVNMVYSDEYLPWPDGTRIKLLRKEIWKDLPAVNHNGITYFVKSDGSIKYEISNAGRMRIKGTNQSVKYSNEGSYFRITDHKRRFFIHRLVYYVFSLKNIASEEVLFDDSFQIDHQNGCKLDNQFANLHAVTQSDNLQHRISRNIESYYTFKAPELIKNPLMQYSKHQKIIVIDEEYIVLSRKDLNGLLNCNNTKNLNISLNKHNLFMKQYTLRYLIEDDRDALMTYLIDHYNCGRYSNEVIKEMNRHE